MAHHKSAKKRIELSERQRQRNRVYRSQLKTALRRVRSAETREQGDKALVNAFSVLDRLATKGIIHKNMAANKKSSLSKFVSRLS